MEAAADFPADDAGGAAGTPPTALPIAYPTALLFGEAPANLPFERATPVSPDEPRAPIGSPPPVYNQGNSGSEESPNNENDGNEHFDSGHTRDDDHITTDDDDDDDTTANNTAHTTGAGVTGNAAARGNERRKPKACPLRPNARCTAA